MSDSSALTSDTTALLLKLSNTLSIRTKSSLLFDAAHILLPDVWEPTQVFLGGLVYLYGDLPNVDNVAKKLIQDFELAVAMNLNHIEIKQKNGLWGMRAEGKQSRALLKVLEGIRRGLVSVRGYVTMLEATYFPGICLNGAVYQNGTTNRLLILGSIPQVLASCTTILDREGRPVALTQHQRELILSLAKFGVRNFACAMKEIDAEAHHSSDTLPTLFHDLSFIGSINFDLGIKKGVVQAVGSFNGCELRTLLISKYSLSYGQHLASRLGVVERQSFIKEIRLNLAGSKTDEIINGLHEFNADFGEVYWAGGLYCVPFHAPGCDSKNRAQILSSLKKQNPKITVTFVAAENTLENFLMYCHPDKMLAATASLPELRELRSADPEAWKERICAVRNFLEVKTAAGARDVIASLQDLTDESVIYVGDQALVAAQGLPANFKVVHDFTKIPKLLERDFDASEFTEVRDVLFLSPRVKDRVGARAKPTARRVAEGTLQQGIWDYLYGCMAV